MESNKIDKKQVIKLVKQMVSNKEAVRSYLKGNITKETLNKKGIKLANPL